MRLERTKAPNEEIRWMGQRNPVITSWKRWFIYPIVYRVEKPSLKLVVFGISQAHPQYEYDMFSGLIGESWGPQLGNPSQLPGADANIAPGNSPILPGHSRHLKCRCLQQQVGNILEDSLWWFNITIEPDPCIADLPINLMMIFNSYVKSSEGSHLDEGWFFSESVAFMGDLLTRVMDHRFNCPSKYTT